MDPSIEIVAGGPMIVRGGLELRRIEHGHGTEPSWRLGDPLATDDSYLLCRCGRSSTMPMCDRTPPYRCFDEEAPTRDLAKPPMWDVPDPAVAVVALKPSGPIRVAGAVPMTGPSGEAVGDHGGRRSLCRCGASRSQPQCDGSHKFAPPIDDPAG